MSWLNFYFTFQAAVHLLKLYFFNHFHSDRLSHTYRYSKYGIVHFVFQGVACHNFYKMDGVFLPEDCFILVNRAVTDEILPYVPYAAFHLGLHCLPKYLFTSIQN